MAEPRWTLRILGDFVLERDGEVVEHFGGRKEEVLLAYLAIDPTTPKARDRIAADLWPENDRRMGLKNISYNMFVMRKRLAEHGLDEPFEDVGNRSLRLNQAIEVDAQVFAEALAAGVADDGRPEALRRALALYGGGLLPVLDEPWLEPHQRQYAQLCELATERLAELSASAGVPEALIRQLPAAAWRGVPEPGARAGAPSPAPAGPAAVDGGDLVAFAREAEAGLQGADAADWRARVDERRGAIVALFEQAVAGGETHDALEIGARLWRYWCREEKSAAGRRWLELLVGTPERGAAALRARAHHGLGCLAHLERDVPAAIEHFARALELWRGLDEPDALLPSLDGLAQAYQANHQPRRAAETYDQAIAIATVLENDEVLDAALDRRARLALSTRDYRAASRLLARRFERSAPGDDAQRAEILALQAQSAVGLEDLDRAAEWAAQASQQLPPDAAPPVRARVLRAQGRVAQHQARYAQALEHFEIARAAAQAARSLPLVGAIMADQALTLRAKGDVDEASLRFERARATLEGAGESVALERLEVEWAEGA